MKLFMKCRNTGLRLSLLSEVKKGDRVEIDFQGFDEGGAPLEKTKSANHPLFIGEGTLIPGFEGACRNEERRQEKNFRLNFRKIFIMNL